MNQKWKLDIGSGGDPHPNCNVFLDRYFGTSFHRRGALIKIMPNMVKGDALHLPFKNCSIALVHSYGVIEHVDSPEKFMSECIRVSIDGQINVISGNTLASEIHGLLFYDGVNKGHRWVYDNFNSQWVSMDEFLARKPSYSWKQTLFIRLMRLMPNVIIDGYFFILEKYLREFGIGLYDTRITK